MTWLLATLFGIVSALLIRAALRAVVERMLDDGRWSDDWRVGVGGEGIASAVHDHDLTGSEAHCDAPLLSTRNGAPNSGRRATGLRVRG